MRELKRNLRIIQVPVSDQVKVWEFRHHVLAFHLHQHQDQWRFVHQPDHLHAQPIVDDHPVHIWPNLCNHSPRRDRLEHAHIRLLGLNANLRDHGLGWYLPMVMM